MDERFQIDQHALQRLIDRSPDVYWVLARDLQGFIYLSPSAERLCGAPRRTLETLDAWLQSVHADDRDRVRQAFAKWAARRSDRNNLEYRIVRPDGTVRWVWSRAIDLGTAGGEEQYIAGVVADITLRREAQDALRRSEDRFRHLLATSPGIVYTLQRKGDALLPTWTAPSVARLGYTPAETLSVTWWAEHLHPEDRMLALANMTDLRASDRVVHEYRFARSDGQYVWIHDEAVAVRDPTGVLVEIVGTWTDVSYRKAVELALADQTERYERVVRHISDAIVVDDVDGRVVYATDRFYDLFDIAKSNRDSFTLEDYIAPEWRELLHDRHARRVAGEDVPERFECEGIAGDGTRMWLEVTATPVFQDGAIVGTQSTIRDITEPRRISAALESSERFNRTLLDAMSAEVVVLDTDGTIVASNRAWREFGERSGADAADMREGANYLDICERPGDGSAEGGHEDAMRDLAAGIRDVLAGRRGELLLEYTRQGSRVPRWYACRVRPFHADGLPHVVITHHDITDVKLAERQLQQTQRLESLGTLAGGVAHDLNNTLAPALMACELLHATLPQSSAAHLHAIEASIRRGAELVRQLLTLARTADVRRQRFEPKELLEGVTHLVKTTFPKSIRIRTAFSDELPSVMGDASQIHHAVLNLCLNARDAMPMGGTLAIKARAVSIDERNRPNASVAVGGYVVVTVSDSGTGIAPDVLDRIFDPFFTTKSQDEGTGLGLSMVLGMAKSHGGFVDVDTALGRGSSFALYLPVAEAITDDETDQPVTAVSVIGHGELVLVVDDEPLIRELLQDALQMLDFRVVVASDGAEGLVRFTENRDAVRLVITDISMPTMDGVGMVRTLRRVAPGLAVIAISGLRERHAAAELRELGVDQMLYKPFELPALMTALKSALRGNPQVA